MSDLVREFFPNVPERCQECPGLENAASKIADNFRMVGSAGARVMELEGDEQEVQSDQNGHSVVAEAFTGLAMQRLTEARGVVDKLTTGCESGIIVTPVEEPQGRWRRSPTVKHSSVNCGSAAIESYFVGRSSRVSL